MYLCTYVCIQFDIIYDVIMLGGKTEHAGREAPLPPPLDETARTIKTKCVHIDVIIIHVAHLNCYIISIYITGRQ